MKRVIMLAMCVCGLEAMELTLDIGHTLTTPGAISATCEVEYTYNKAIAEDIGTYVHKHQPSWHVSIPNTGSSRFEDRYASSVGKDLFISVHHDSVQPQFLTYNAKGCPTSTYASGYSIFISRKNPDLNRSIAYAKALGKALREEGLTPTLHHAQKITGENRELLDAELGIYYFDDLKVLKHASSPALLLESGVIVNPNDEKTLRTRMYHEKIARSIARALGSR